MKLSPARFQLALVVSLIALASAAVALVDIAVAPSFYFEVSMSSSTTGTGQIFYDLGRDFNEHDSERLPLRGARSTAIYRFPLPEGKYRLIRFDPLDHGNADIVIRYARIVDAFGRDVRAFSLSELTVASGVSHFEITGGEMLLTLGSADNDSNLIINPLTPIALHAAPLTRFLFAGRIFLLFFLPSAALGILWIKPRSFLKRPLKRPLLWAVVFFAACLIYCVWAAVIGWNDVAAGFRETQTAITCFYMLHQPLALAYQTPVLGPPWAVPMEFPLYQWVVASVVNLFGTPLDQTGRLVSFLFFLLTLVPTYFLLGVCRVSRPHRLVFLAVIAVSPFYIFWARDFMMETTALFFSVAYLAFTALYTERPKKRLIVLACICGTLAGLVKITTFAIFVIPAACFLMKDLLQRPLRLPGWSVVLQKCANLALSVGVPLAVALWWTHYADRVKEQNPFGHYLTSSYLTEWNFGTMAQRLSGHAWHTLLARAPSLLTYNKVFWVACVLALIITRRRWKEVGACLILYLAVPLVFTNLHVIHDYYMCANGIFLLGAVGFSLVAILETPGGQKLGFAAAVAALVLAASAHRSLYVPRQRETHRALASQVKEYVKGTAPDAVIIYLGFDWSSTWPYYSERRALMIPGWGYVTDPDVRKALANLRGHKIGGVIVTGEPIYPLDSLIANMNALGLDTSNVRRVN